MTATAGENYGEGVRRRLRMVCCDFFEKRYYRYPGDQRTTVYEDGWVGRCFGWFILLQFLAALGAMAVVRVFFATRSCPVLRSPGDWHATISLFREESGRTAGIAGRVRRTGAIGE